MKSIWLMAVITAGVQLIPASMIGVLAAAGSTNPTAIIGPTLVATSIGTAAGIFAARILQRFYPQGRTPAAATAAAGASPAETTAPEAPEAPAEAVSP